jgi:hypothetical protein
MANVSLPRPALEAHRNSLMLPMPELLQTLVSNVEAWRPESDGALLPVLGFYLRHVMSMAVPTNSMTAFATRCPTKFKTGTELDFLMRPINEENATSCG